MRESAVYARGNGATPRPPAPWCHCGGTGGVGLGHQCRRPNEGIESKLYLVLGSDAVGTNRLTISANEIFGIRTGNSQSLYDCESCE